MDNSNIYYKKYIKYKNKYNKIKMYGLGHGSCTQCKCINFSADNFNQHCQICHHSYKNHKLTVSDWMIKIYNLDKAIKLYMKGDYCNLNKCIKCNCDKYSDNLIDDKCAACSHNVLNHCQSYNNIF